MPMMKIEGESLNNVETESVSNETEKTKLSNKIDNENLLDEVKNITDQVDSSLVIQENNDETAVSENNDKTVPEVEAENAVAGNTTVNIVSENNIDEGAMQIHRIIKVDVHNDFDDEDLAEIVEQYDIQEALALNHDENKMSLININNIIPQNDNLKNVKSEIDNKELDEIVLQYNIQETLGHNNIEYEVPQNNIKNKIPQNGIVENIKLEEDINDEDLVQFIRKYHFPEIPAVNNVENEVSQDNVKSVMLQNDIENRTYHNVSQGAIFKKMLQKNNVQNSVVQNNNLKSILKKNNNQNIVIRKNYLNSKSHATVLEEISTFIEQENINDILKENSIDSEVPKEDGEEDLKKCNEINGAMRVDEVPKKDEEDLAERNEVNGEEVDEAPKEDGEEELAELNGRDESMIVDEDDDDNYELLIRKIANELASINVPDQPSSINNVTNKSPMNNIANESPPMNNVVNDLPPINNVANELASINVPDQPSSINNVTNKSPMNNIANESPPMNNVVNDLPPINNVANEPPQINNVANEPPRIINVPPHKIANQQEWVIRARKKLLRHAVEWNDIERVNELLEENINYIDGVDDCNRTPLYLAVLHQKPLIAQILIEKGANVNIKDNKTEMTPLHVAVKNKDKEMVRLLICQGANLDETNKYHVTPLHMALESGNEDILLMLLKKGANVDVIRHGKSLIILAVESGYMNMVKLLRDYGCDINFVSSDGKTALHVAVESQTIKIIKMLLDLGARCNIRAPKVSVLDIAAKKANCSIVRLLLDNLTDSEDCQRFGNPALTVAFQNRKQSVVHTLLMRGVDPKSQHRENKSFLHMAIELDWAFTVSLLLDKGIDVNTVTYDMVSALHLAVDVGNTDIIKMLIKRGANLNARTSYGATPLYIAVQKAYDDIAKILLEAGADPDIKDDGGLAPIHLAFEQENRDLINLLLDHKADPNILRFRKTLLELAMDLKWLDVMQRLMKEGANVNALTGYNWSILTEAVKRGNIDIIKMLLDFGADLEIKDKKTWMTPLQFAIAYSTISVTAYLLERGADLNYATPCGVTALQIAFNQRDAAVVRLLLEKNAAVGTVFGKSPLRVAVELRWLSIAKMLLERGCDPNECIDTFEGTLRDAMRRNDKYLEKRLREKDAIHKLKLNGYSLLHTAAERGMAEMAELLLDHGADINRQDFDDATPLHVALKNTNDQFALKLIERGANLRIVEDRLKRTTLHLAVEGECYETVKVVLKKRVIDIDTQDNRRMTALFLAAAKNNNFLVELLLKYGAKVDICNRSGNCTVLHYALRNRNQKMAKMLLLVGMPIHCRCRPVDTAMGLALHTMKEDWMVEMLLERDLEDQQTVVGIKAIELFMPHIGHLHKDSHYITWILMHLARKSADAQYVDYRRYNIPRNLRLTYEYFCAEILRMLKDEKMEHSPYHRILIKDPQMMATLERDPKFLAAVEEWDYKARYPSYGCVIQEYLENIKNSAETPSIEKKRNTSVLATWCSSW